MIDETVFMREVNACELSLYRISRTLLHSSADCADAVQEALLKAWQHRGRVDEAHFRAYLTRIVINECHNIGRRRSRMTVVEKIPQQTVMPPMETFELRDALEKLDTSLRLVLVMHELEGYTLSEISQALRVPLGTIKWRLSRAKRALRAQWDESKGEREV